MFYIYIFCSDFNPEWLTADAAEKPAVLLYFLSFWCLDWADGNPMSHRRQPVPPWLPQWHAVPSLTRLHNSLRLLLSHQPFFFFYGDSNIGNSLLQQNDAIQQSFVLTGMFNQTDGKHTLRHTRTKSIRQNRKWIKWSWIDEKGNKFNNCLICKT